MLRFATRACAVVFVAALSCSYVSASPKRVMPWFCLQRCGLNVSEIEAGLEELQQHWPIITSSAFELFNLGANGTLEDNSQSLYPVAKPLQAIGEETFPMISSYPYPPEFLDWMRQLWTTSAGDHFIAQLIEQATAQGFTGYNVDWEPASGNPTPDDAVNYAAYLDKMALALHNEGFKVSVDIASWSGIWNWTAIAATAVDRIIVMDTYTDDAEHFQTSLSKAIQIIGIEKLGVGLSTLNLTSNGTLPEPDVAYRFSLLQKAQVQEVDIWQMNIPDFWWPYLATFVSD